MKLKDILGKKNVKTVVETTVKTTLVCRSGFCF